MKTGYNIQKQFHELESTGAYTNLENLIAQRHGANILKLFKPPYVLSQLAGNYYSRIRGRGVDFEEARPYQPGDDVRTIDWRVTARTQKTHTKVYREEREKPVLILSDQSHSTFFGSQQRFKSVAITQISALIAWAALKNGDRVGGLVFSDTEHCIIRPKNTKNCVLQLLNQLNKFNHKLHKPMHTLNNDSLALDEALGQARQVARPGSSLFLVSDFNNIGESGQQHLYQLSRHIDVVAIKVYDALEQMLPKPGSYTISNGVQRLAIETYSKQLRNEYHQHYEQHEEALKKILQRLQIPLVVVSTGQNIIETLIKTFNRQ